MASRARRLSSLKVGLVGELSPLNRELLANGLMPNQPTSCFLMAAHRPDSSVTTLVSAVYGVRITCNWSGYFSIIDLMCGRWCDEMPVNRARPVVRGPVERGHGLLDLGVRVLNALLQQRDPPEVDVIEARLLHPLVEGLHQLLARPPLGEAALLRVPGEPEVDLVAPALENL